MQNLHTKLCFLHSYLCCITRENKKSRTPFFQKSGITAQTRKKRLKVT